MYLIASCLIGNNCMYEIVLYKGHPPVTIITQTLRDGPRDLPLADAAPFCPSEYTIEEDFFVCNLGFGQDICLTHANQLTITSWSEHHPDYSSLPITNTTIYTSRPTSSHCYSPYIPLSSHQPAFFFHLITSTYTATPTSTPSTPSTRLSSIGPLFTDPHSSHPILPPAMPLCEIGITFTDPSLPPSHIHKSTQTPSYMRPATQHLTHTDTMRLRSSHSGVNPSDLFLNDIIINHTLQILHHHSPYTTTRHYLTTPFLEVIQRPNNDIFIPRFHRRFL